MKNRIILFFLAACAALSLAAQMPKNVQWRLIVKMTSATEGVATLKGMIEPGWHMYGTTPVKGGPQPTVIDFSQSKGITLVGKPAPSPAPVSGHDQLFNMKLTWWENSVAFRQKFKVKDAAGATVKCSVRYTTCNNERCSMPVTENLSKPVKK